MQGDTPAEVRLDDELGTVAERADDEAPHVDDAYYMGATGGEATEGERLAFESWMRGHCWALCARWDGKQYRSDDEASGDVNPHAMRTRQLWAAWRDRAALARVKGHSNAST
jgi:hypothetical protein